MNKFLLTICFAICFYSYSKAQDILVNRYFNSATAAAGTAGEDDVVELVVVKDHLDIRKYVVKDYANGGSNLDDGGAKFRFNDIELWKNLRSGTTIVLRRMSASELGSYTPDVDASDFKISIAVNDTRYMTDLAVGKAWNMTVNEVVLISADTESTTGDGANKAIHALGVGIGNYYSRAVWNAIMSPKSLLDGYTGGNNVKGVVALTMPNAPTYTTPFDPNADLITLPLYWQKETALMAGFPAGIQVFRTTTPYNGRQMNAYAVVFDPRLVEFKPTHSATFKTPQNFVNDETGTVLACLNGGFFFTTALSHIQYNGTTAANNVASLNRSVYNGTTSTYYPTRGTFGLSPTWKPDITWTYKVGNNVYSYSVPSPNDVNDAPQPVPTTTGGTIWNVVSAIGGSPVLVKNSVVNVTSAQELADLDNTAQRGRSAIGYTADGKVVLLAVEGGNTTVSPNVMGLSLNDLSNLMLDMGCVAALNLDGGGSTTLRINNQLTVRPSNPNGEERTMPGVILIKSKN
ncbi:MAG: phosphodiester glycosidase family protein [Pedobacter sp.]|uniref:phosphodiester glycosidase family protein n=1 Tax=Pedobacter sp. TaxID=1411316 RepID=UPI002807D265|nr:phosphodiester glycosidase family protein [Pedobacter sp.]MDQ8003173.1 phosphodiester glycosidase family protein [Pedobacter sp.]